MHKPSIVCKFGGAPSNFSGRRLVTTFLFSQFSLITNSEMYTFNPFLRSYYITASSPNIFI